MLIDDFMPTYDFIETHDIQICAKTEDVYSILKDFNLCESAIVRLLFRLRGMPSDKMTLREIHKLRFEVLGESENHEILLGLAGRFWTLRGDMQKVNSQNFREFDKEGYAKATWNFSLSETVKGASSLLTTETRIKCLDKKSRTRFGFYWMFIQPFSALIRKEILRTIRRKVEQARSVEV